MNTIKIGLAIAELRKRQGFTQRQLAGKLNVSDKAVSKWERGQGLPDISILSSLSMILDCDIESLLEGNANSSTKEKWVGFLNLINTDVVIDSLIYDKTLIAYQLGYFMLLGIKDIYIICNNSQQNTINDIVKKLNINIIFIKKYNEIKNSNVMYIYEPLFIYGQNLTRSFQKATERKNGVTVLSLPEHITNNISIFYDSKHKVVIEEKKSMETAYNYNALPIIFYPKKYYQETNTSLFKTAVKELINKDILYTEPMFRGVIYIPLRSKEDVEDASKIVEIIQKRDYPIGDLNEISSKRGL